MPQTIGHPHDSFKEEVTYPSGVVRYSGSALHVSCDETYPHSVSLVDIAERGGDVTVRQLYVDQLRHFYVLPEDSGKSFSSSDEALAAVKEFADEKGSGYFRLRVAYEAALPSDFNQSVYEIIKVYDEQVRYNPKIIWTGVPHKDKAETLVFEVAELQQMTDPMKFIEKTSDRYQGLNIDDLREVFREVEEEIKSKGDK
jgi:exonuclease SbcD